MMPPMDVTTEPIADAKDRLRDEGVVVGPDRYGNWFVPCGKRGPFDWKPGDRTEERVLVRNNGALAGSPCAEMIWDWQVGRWVENTAKIGEGDGPLPQIY